MATPIFVDPAVVGDVIRVEGVCYRRSGPSEVPFNIGSGDIEGSFNNCDECGSDDYHVWYYSCETEEISFRGSLCSKNNLATDWVPTSGGFYKTVRGSSCGTGSPVEPSPPENTSACDDCAGNDPCSINPGTGAFGRAYILVTVRMYPGWSLIDNIFDFGSYVDDVVGGQDYRMSGVRGYCVGPLSIYMDLRKSPDWKLTLTSDDATFVTRIPELECPPAGSIEDAWEFESSTSGDDYRMIWFGRCVDPPMGDLVPPNVIQIENVMDSVQGFAGLGDPSPNPSYDVWDGTVTRNDATSDFWTYGGTESLVNIRQIDGTYFLARPRFIKSTGDPLGGGQGMFVFVLHVDFEGVGFGATVLEWASFCSNWYDDLRLINNYGQASSSSIQLFRKSSYRLIVREPP